MIEVNHVSLCYRMSAERVSGMKEFLVQALQGKLQYKEFWALQDVDFSIEKGEVLGLVGANGAGKSTMLKVISGILKPTKGTVTVHGNIVPMLELGSGFDLELTGRENVFLNGAILGYSEDFLKEKYQEIVDFSELGEFIEMPLRNYSSGMITRLAFAIATVTEPDILIVDETLSVGDFLFQQKCERRIKELVESDNVTVLLVSHDISLVERICDRVCWIEKGHMRMIGETDEVCEAYRSLQR